MRGTRREGSFTGEPKCYVKALEMGVCFHTGPAFGEHGGALLGNMKVRFFLGLLKEKKNYFEKFLCGFRDTKNVLKQESLSIGGPAGELGVCLPGLLREKKKYIWVPFLDPEGINILSLGAMWNFSKGAELH